MECRLHISTLTAAFWQFLSLSLSVICSSHMQVAHKATALLMPALGYTAVTSTSPLFITPRVCGKFLFCGRWIGDALFGVNGS